MTLIERRSRGIRFGRALGATAAAAALAGTAACGARDNSMAAAAPLAAPQALAQPAAASCASGGERAEPAHPRPLCRRERRGAVAGRVRDDRRDADLGAGLYVRAGAGDRGAAGVLSFARPAPVVYDDLGDARIVQRPATVQPARQVVYRDERPVRAKRSVAKSAVIIGSTAGAGAASAR